MSRRNTCQNDFSFFLFAAPMNEEGKEGAIISIIWHYFIFIH